MVALGIFALKEWTRDNKKLADGPYSPETVK